MAGHKGARVESVVRWRVERLPAITVASPAAAKVGRVLGAFGLRYVSVGPPARRPAAPPPRGRPRARLPRDRSVEISLVPALVDGVAPWLTASWNGPQRIRLTQVGAFVYPWGPGPPAWVPLGELRVVSARPEYGGDSHRYADSVWVLHVTGADGTDVTVRGPWLTLAWIGYLGEWPDPAS